MKINYVIATFNSKTKRIHKYPPPEDILKIHLTKILEYDSNLSQITIMKAKSDNYYKNYYDLDDIISKTDIPIKFIDCENYGYSMGQWLKAYEIYKDNFDYYLFIEDDYCPRIDNFDKILIDCFHKKFNKNGLLCSLVLGSKNFKSNGHPIHFEGCVFINKETLQKLYNFPKWESNPRLWLDKLDSSYGPSFSDFHKKISPGGYYQVAFSHLFTLSNIKHEDYLHITYDGKLLQFPYWDDDKRKNIGGEIWFYDKGDKIRKTYTIDDIYNSPIIPVQLSNVSSIKFNTHINNFPIEIFPERICLDIVDNFKHIVKDKIVCDIGCGAGDMLEYLKLRKLCKEVKGVEINQHRYNKNRKYVNFGDVFNIGLPNADVYIIWLGINFPYEKLFNLFKKDAIILLLDSNDINHKEFQKYKNIKLIEMIDFNYDENNFINPNKKDEYINLLKNKYQSTNSNFKITGKRFFGVYQFTFI